MSKTTSPRTPTPQHQSPQPITSMASIANTATTTTATAAAAVAAGHVAEMQHHLHTQIVAMQKQRSAAIEERNKAQSVNSLLALRVTEKETELGLLRAALDSEVKAHRASEKQSQQTIATLRRRLDAGQERSNKLPQIEAILLQIVFEARVLFGTMPTDGREAARFRERCKACGFHALFEDLRRSIRTHVAACRDRDKTARRAATDEATVHRLAAEDKRLAVAACEAKSEAVRARCAQLKSELDAAKQHTTQLTNEIAGLKKQHRAQMAALRMDVQELRSEARARAKAAAAAALAPQTSAPDNSRMELSKLMHDMNEERKLHKAEVHQLTTAMLQERLSFQAQLKTFGVKRVNQDAVEGELRSLKVRVKNAEGQVVRSRVRDTRERNQVLESALQHKDAEISQLSKEVERLSLKVSEQGTTMATMKKEYAEIFEAHLKARRSAQERAAKKGIKEGAALYSGESAPDTVSYYRSKLEDTREDLEKAEKKIRSLILHVHYARTRFERFQTEVSLRMRNMTQKKDNEFDFVREHNLSPVPEGLLSSLFDDEQLLPPSSPPPPHAVVDDETGQATIYDFASDGTPNVLVTPTAGRETSARAVSPVGAPTRELELSAVINFAKTSPLPEKNTATTTTARKIPYSEIGTAFNFHTVGQPKSRAFDMSLLPHTNSSSGLKQQQQLLRPTTAMAGSSSSNMTTSPSVSGKMRPQSAQLMRRRSSATKAPSSSTKRTSVIALSGPEIAARQQMYEENDHITTEEQQQRVNKNQTLLDIRAAVENAENRAMWDELTSPEVVAEVHNAVRAREGAAAAAQQLKKKK
eukprot:PhM_4_TR12363/c0_g1_i1/m.64843